MKKIYIFLMLLPIIGKSQNLLLDQFTFPTNIKTLVAQINTPAPSFAFTSTTNSTTTLGGELDIASFLTISTNPVQMDVFENGYQTKTLEMNQGTGEVGTLNLTWDGFDGSSQINYTGLGSKSISNCGALFFNYYTDFGISNHMTAKLTIYTDATHASEVTKVFNGTGGGTVVAFTPASIALSGLTMVTGMIGPANLGNIGAVNIEFSFDINGVDFLLDDIQFSCPSTLPISLINFNVNSATSKNIVSWGVASATNVKKFIVERSFDGNNFTGIGEANYQTNLANYTFEDKKYATTVYYRLKALEFDGTFKNSKIVVVKPNSINKAISLTSNTIDNQIQLVFNIASKNDYVVSIIDAVGRKYKTEQVTVNQGISIFNINDLQNLPSGLFYVAILNKQNEKEVFKIFKK